MSLLEQILHSEENKEYFLTLIFEETRVSAATATVGKEQIHILSTGKESFTENQDEIETCDRAITSAEKNLGEKTFIEKVIFGLPISYLDGEKIKEEKLGHLKKICHELSLKPHGFIEHPQAITFYLEKTEESAPTLILILVEKSNLTFSLIRVGKIEKNVIVARNSSILESFEDALSHFSAEILPSRILIYNQTDIFQEEEKFRETLMSFPWHKHSSFLHTPKIEILPGDTLLKATVETAGGTIIKELHLDETKEKIKEDFFGFVKGQDIQDISKPVVPQKSRVTEISTPIQKKKTIVSNEEDYETENLLSRLKSKRNITYFISLPNKLRYIFALIFSIITLVFSFYLLINFYPKATVSLIVYPEISSKEKEVIFLTNQENKSQENSVKTTKITEELEGEKTIAVSSKKNIGEPAKGEVTIYNKTLSTKTFPKGTVLISDNLQFTLDTDINVASASDTGEGLIFGKTSGKITASQIGPEGNLTANKTFTFKDFPHSSYYAKNSSNLEGGTSREVLSVSKIDQDRLLLDLVEELTSKAKTKLAQKVKPGERIIEDSPEKEIISQKFNRNLGEEAKDLSLSLKLRVSAHVFSEKEVIELAKDNFTSPSGFSLDLNKTSVKIDKTQTLKNGDIKANIILRAYLLPQISTETIRKEIAGKSYSDVVSSLSQNNTIAGVKIIKERSLPILSENLPLRAENIAVNILFN